MLDSAVDLWATDEGHFRNMDRAAACGYRRRSRTRSLQAPTRKSVGYFDAVRLRDGKFLFRRESGRFNAETFFQFLLVFRQASSHPQRQVVVISDNARYHKAVAHRAWREQHAAQFALDFLPPYSPELNLIERVWKLTRRLRLHNRYFEALDDVATAVEGQFNNWTDASDTLRRLCATI